MRAFAASISAVMGLLPTASTNVSGAADRARADARSAARQNPKARGVRNLTKLTIVGVCGLAFGLAGQAPAGKAAEFRYHLVPLDTTVPDGFDAFDPVKILDNGQIYGNAWACSHGGCKSFVAVYRKGHTTVLRQGRTFTANEAGIVGGNVVTGRTGSQVQAALFDGLAVKLIPRLQDEINSNVLRINNSNVALVQSTTRQAISYYLYSDGSVTPLNFGLNNVFYLDINDRKTISGSTYSTEANAYRAFRFRPPTGPATLLSPVSPDPNAWGVDINNAGDVLGWSFVYGGIERIGFWHGRQFHAQFIEGTAEVPTISNRLLWNEKGLIVVTATTDLSYQPEGRSYLVPRAGVRLNLADLTDTLPPWTLIASVNDGGDLVGFGGTVAGTIEESFLLRRVGSGSAPVAGPPSHAPNSVLVAARLAALRDRGLLVSKEKAPER
jgi:hypothetical protein